MTTSNILSQLGSAGVSTGFKNRIINGAMVIDQRNSGASVTQDTSGTQYCLDRWTIYGNVAGKFTAQQNAGSVTPPVGFTNYLGITSTSAYSIGSGDAFQLVQRIEGFNYADLNWGTANAKTVTLSFQVYSSLTGTFGGSFVNGANNYSYPFTYSIPVANTWTAISVTVAGPTSGTWVGATNGVGVGVYFGLGVGSSGSGTAGSWQSALYRSATGATSVVGTNGATFYITGVQLEVGTTATNFDYRSIGTELALCQRYFQVAGRGYGYARDSSSILINYQCIVTMRAIPSLALTTASPYIENVPWASIATTSGCTVDNGHMSVYGGDVKVSGSISGISANQFIEWGSAQLLISSEL